MKIKFFLCLLAVIGFGYAQGQDALKIGYTNAEYVLAQLPEAKQIESELTTYEQQLQNQIQAKYQDLQAKFADYQQNEATYNDVVKADKQKELQDLQTSLQEFQVNAEQSMSRKRNELLAPAVEKIGNAIKAVAEENGYTFIFSVGAPGLDVLLYGAEQYDVSDLVLAKLGIEPPAEGG